MTVVEHSTSSISRDNHILGPIMTTAYNQFFFPYQSALCKPFVCLHGPSKVQQLRGRLDTQQRRIADRAAALAALSHAITDDLASM
jgi:hypothetical protein